MGKYMKPPFKMIVETEMEKYRHDTFWTKEPETIEWIKSFKPHDVFFDVGANVGIYSLYAASLFPKMNIIAFEPMLANITALQDNRDENEFWNILCSPYAVGNICGWFGLTVPDETPGATGAQVIFAGKAKNSTKIITIDSLHTKPTHIKIDIDGQEVKVVRGMVNTLKREELKSVLIEIDNDKEEIIFAFLFNGFTTDNRFNKMKNHSRVRRAREGINAENVIFTRGG